MTLPIIVLIAAVAGLAAAGAIWFLFDRSTSGTRSADRLVIPGAAFLVAAIVVGGGLFALTRGSSGEPERKVLEAIQRHHPEAANEIAAIRRETNPTVAQKRASDLAQRYLPRHIPTTSDAAVVRFTSETTKVFENLAQRDPENCKALATGGATSATFDSASMRPALDAMAQVVDDSVDQSQPPPQPQRAQQLLAGVVERVYAKQPNDLAPLQLLTQPATVPAPQLCRTMIAFYREILNLPPADASQVLRSLMRGGQPPRG
jgi:hypothetical protein